MLNTDYTATTACDLSATCCENEINNSINTVGVYPQNKMKDVLNATDDKWVQFFIPEIYDIPDIKPNMEGIISVSSCVDIISQRVIKTPTVTGTTINGVKVPGDHIPNAEGTLLTGKKLIVEGILKQKVMYTSTATDQAIHTAHFSVPFSVFIIVDVNTPLTQRFKIQPFIEDIFACRLSERSLFKNTTLFLKASLIC